MTTVTSITRGAILTVTADSGKNAAKGTNYKFVRVATGVADNFSGKSYDVYNLVNEATGRTRVSKPERMFRVLSGNDNIALASVARHFNLPLAFATCTKTVGAGVNSLIAKAKAEAEAKARAAALPRFVAPDFSGLVALLQAMVAPPRTTAVACV